MNSFWDDWMRKPEQRRNRACIRPEVARTGISVEGKRGVSGYVTSMNWFHYIIMSVFVEANFTTII